jgi:arylsulfatase A-like enzyme
MRTFLLLILFAVATGSAAERPNIVFILADDLGVGDVHAFNPAGKIATPRLDRLAGEGMKLTDAHTPSSVCTPTRYGLLTGRYNWRSRLQSGVLGGLSPRLIEPGRLTVAQLLKDQGYVTACIGKWHLGLDWVKKPGGAVTELDIEKPEQNKAVDFTQPFANGPRTLGFDYYFGIAASLDMVPYTFLENDRCTMVPTTEKKFPMMGDAESKGFTRFGPAAAEFEAVDVLPRLAERAGKWIEEHAADAKAGKPFFLYVPLNSPHTPSLPAKDWTGKSGLNAYADFVMQTDAAVGAVLDALEKAGLSEQTLVIATSDNGCSPQARLEQLRGKGHDPCNGWRGTKADIWEGGHRVPLIVRWPGKVKPGTASDALVCLTDFMATCADLTGAKLPASAGEDSVSFLPVLRGEAGARTTLVSHSIAGHFAIRSGNMKLCLTPGSGGWSVPKPGSAEEKELPDAQLYDLAADPAEARNLIVEQPDKVKELTALLEKYVAEGRSTPGERQKNTVGVKIRKGRVEPKTGSE